MPTIERKRYALTLTDASSHRLKVGVGWKMRCEEGSACIALIQPDGRSAYIRSEAGARDNKLVLAQGPGLRMDFFQLTRVVAMVCGLAIGRVVENDGVFTIEFLDPDEYETNPSPSTPPPPP